MCGIFSFHGRIVPLTEISQGSRTSMTLSKCEVKETLPMKIYKSEAAAKNGLEFFINQEGHFVRSFEELLIKKHS